MAGEWIKMRTNLWDDPRVGRICDMTGLLEAQVIGGLYWLWATADEHTENGLMPGLSTRQIDRKTGCQGLGAALVAIGWLFETDEGVTLENFEEHNGASAKKRCQTAKRVANFKSGNAEVMQLALPGHTDSVSGALPREDKRREEEIKNTPLPPKGGGRDAYTPEFEAAWKAYPDRPNASKADAFKAWNARIRAGALPEVMTAGVERYAAFCRASKTEPRFVKQPSTFFGPGGHFLAEWSAPEAEPDAALTPGTDEYRSVNRHAPWVLKAGFRNIWEAENEGCYERNAHLFSGGKKTQAVPA